METLSKEHFVGQEGALESKYSRFLGFLSLLFAQSAELINFAPEEPYNSTESKKQQRFLYSINIITHKQLCNIMKLGKPA